MYLSLVAMCVLPINKRLIVHTFITCYINVSCLHQLNLFVLIPVIYMLIVMPLTTIALLLLLVDYVMFCGNTFNSFLFSLPVLHVVSL